MVWWNLRRTTTTTGTLQRIIRHHHQQQQPSKLRSSCKGRESLPYYSDSILGTTSLLNADIVAINNNNNNNINSISSRKKSIRQQKCVFSTHSTNNIHYDNIHYHVNDNIFSTINHNPIIGHEYEESMDTTKSIPLDGTKDEDWQRSTDDHAEEKHKHRKMKEGKNFKTNRHNPRSSLSSSRPPPSVPTLLSLLENLTFKDIQLPCRQHLDPYNKLLPNHSWIKIMNTLPTNSMEEVISSIESILYEMLIVKNNDDNNNTYIIDLDAVWNPIQDETIPQITMNVGNDDEQSQQQQPYQVQAAYVDLSPFGRPTGWKLKLMNPSMVYALLLKGKEDKNGISVGWKVVQIKEYIPPTNEHDINNMSLMVDDSMVRIENCPSDLNAQYLRYMLSRYDLAHTGNTIMKWNGRTDDGRTPPLTYVVRFATSAWARAAIREMQNMEVNGKNIRLVQYPRQRLLPPKAEQ